MQILAVSDQIVNHLYTPQASSRFGDVDAVISCGDLPYYYVEYLVDKLNRPTFYVRGNHAHAKEIGEQGVVTHPGGAVDLHRRVARLKLKDRGRLLLAGVEGSLRYREGPYMYTQWEMWRLVYLLLPGLLYNRIRYGRWLDVFVTHAPPWGIHDESDLPHLGIKAFLWLDRVFQPAYHLHGHIHLHHQVKRQETMLNATCIVNVFGHQVIHLPAEQHGAA